MIRSIVYGACITALATAAQASTLQLWLSPDAFAPGTPGVVPLAQPGDTLYLFAATDNATWSEITIDIAGTSDVWFYSDFYMTIARWDPTSILYGPSISATKGAACGLGSGYESYGTLYRNGCYLVGQIIVQDDVYITNHTITKEGGTPGSDAVVWGNNAPIAGNQDVTLPNPIATTHCPEPAGILSIALLGLLIRGR